jgi:hypothetical protein
VRFIWISPWSSLWSPWNGCYSTLDRPIIFSTFIHRTALSLQKKGAQLLTETPWNRVMTASHPVDKPQVYGTQIDLLRWLIDTFIKEAKANLEQS